MNKCGQDRLSDNSLVYHRQFVREKTPATAIYYLVQVIGFDVTSLIDTN